MKSERVKKWDAANSKRYTIQFMLKTEADLIAKLDSVPNRAGYIKDLIRKDIEREA